MALEVPSDVESAVRQRVESGVYHSADEVLRMAIHALAWAEQDPAGKLHLLRAAIRAGVDEAERGDLIPGDEVFGPKRKPSPGEGA
jgi:putative addiction module CopG family antidote